MYKPYLHPFTKWDINILYIYNTGNRLDMIYILLQFDWMGIWVSDSGFHGNLLVFGDISWMMVVIRRIKWDTCKDNLGLVEIEWDLFYQQHNLGTF
jgi:hypothetical protein